jgi:hypothetical protein
MRSKNVDRIVAALRSKGANVEPRGSQRYAVTAPGKQLVFMPTTDPRDPRALDNKVAALRRAGYDI